MVNTVFNVVENSLQGFHVVTAYPKNISFGFSVGFGSGIDNVKYQHISKLSTIVVIL
jgi:hypothetical protein